MKGTVKEEFETVFRLAAKNEPGLINVFAKIHKMLRVYAGEIRRRALAETELADFVREDGELNPSIVKFTHDFYMNLATTRSQLSLLRTVAGTELRFRRLQSDVTGTPISTEVIDDSKLKPYMREIWLKLPRVKGSGLNGPYTIQRRSSLPLTDLSRDLWRMLQEVEQKSESDSVAGLLVGCHQLIKHKIKTTINHSLRRKLFCMLSDLRRSCGISRVNSNLPAFKVDQLPTKLSSESQLFLDRAPKGLAAFDDLRSLAEEYEWELTEPLTDTAIRDYQKALLTAAPYMELDEDVGIENLLRLESYKRVVKGREITGLHNTYVERYRQIERSRVRDGKRANYDSTIFKHFTSGLGTIARFNGIFDLQEAFNSAYKIKLDKKSKKNRKSRKKVLMGPDWIDGEIRRLKIEFDKIIESQSFLVNDKDLKLCIFLPQLTTLRYLGYRQQCLRRSELGKNIIIDSIDSFTFHFEPGEIKNEMLIHQSFSRAVHGGLPEIALLIDVLTTYKLRVLDVIHSVYGGRYEANVGTAFFVKKKWKKSDCLIERFKRKDEKDGAIKRATDEHNSGTHLAEVFKSYAYELMDFSKLKSQDIHFNPHFLRGVCCDWMRKVLKWSWEEISKAMGDTELTLKQAYYEPEKKIQDGTDSFARSSKERRDAEDLKRGTSSVVSISDETLKLVKSQKKSLDALAKQLKTAERRAKKAEEERDKLTRKLTKILDSLASLPHGIAILSDVA